MCNEKCGCIMTKIAGILVLVGALNWGLTGIGMLVGSDLNLVNLLLGSWPMVEAIVYVIVGICAVVQIFGCPCAACKSCKASCANCKVDATPATPATPAQ